MRLILIHLNDPTFHLVPAKWDHINRPLNQDIYCHVAFCARCFKSLYTYIAVLIQIDPFQACLTDN